VVLPAPSMPKTKIRLCKAALPMAVVDFNKKFSLIRAQQKRFFDRFFINFISLLAVSQLHRVVSYLFVMHLSTHACMRNRYLHLGPGFVSFHFTITVFSVHNAVQVAA
jgi:hypothetical protein